MEQRIQIEQFQNNAHYRIYRLPENIPLANYEEIIDRINSELSGDIQRVIIASNYVLVQIARGSYWKPVQGESSLSPGVEAWILGIIQDALDWDKYQLFRAHFFSLSTRLAHPNATPRNIREERPPSIS